MGLPRKHLLSYCPMASLLFASWALGTTLTVAICLTGAICMALPVCFIKNHILHTLQL